MKFRSPLLRLVGLYCALLLVLGAAFALFTVESFEHYANQTIAREVRARSREIWNTAKETLGNPGALAALLEARFAPEAQGHFIRISDAAHVIYQSGESEGSGLEPPPPPVHVGAGVSGVFQSAHYVLDRQTYHLTGGRPILVESGQSDLVVENAEWGLIRALLWGMPVLLILSAIGGYVLMRRSLHAVEMMIDAAEAITFNDPKRRLPLANTGDRIETLGLVLNRMLDRLDETLQYANRFSTDAAHELRTPLAIVRGELEFVAGQPLPVELRTSLAVVLDEVNRLSDMVDNLGMLSRMDSLWAKQAHTEFDLFALARDTIDQMRLLAEDKFVALSGHTTMVAGDPGRLKQVLVNLLDNAIKYTPPGGRVDVEVRPSGLHAILTVKDTGIGIADEHRTRIFDRFFRISADRGTTGSGLGLSIVRAICHAHGGSVEVESVPGAGSVFRVIIPAGNAVPEPVSMRG